MYLDTFDTSDIIDPLKNAFISHKALSKVSKESKTTYSYERMLTMASFFNLK